MTLFQQFQVFVGSIVIGMLFSFLWSVFNRIFYGLQGKWVRIPFETIFLSLLALIYFLFLHRINGGILNLHYFLALIIGVLLYLKFYARNINIWLEEIAIKLKLKILVPLKKRYGILVSKIKKILTNIKKRRAAKRDGKRKKKKEATE